MSAIDQEILRSMLAAGLIGSIHAPVEQVEAILADTYGCRISSLRERMATGHLTKAQILAALAGRRHASIRLDIEQLGLGGFSGPSGAWL